MVQPPRRGGRTASGRGGVRRVRTRTGSPHERLTWVNAGYAHLLMDNRGQGGQYGCGGDTPTRTPARPGVPDRPRGGCSTRTTTTTAG
ncbi:acetylxylan esterase [Streptomyces erythrogriseus]